jgi:hypothetical protein
VADERTTVSATTVAASSGTTQQVQIGSSSETELAGDGNQHWMIISFATSVEKGTHF